MLSGGVFALAYPPLGWGWLVVPGLAGLLVALQGQRGAKARAIGFLHGLVTFAVGLSWLYGLFGLWAVALWVVLAAFPALFAHLQGLASARGITGGKLAAFRNNSQGGFDALEGPLLVQPAERDLAGVVAVEHAARGVTILVAESNYEDQRQPTRLRALRGSDGSSTTFEIGASAPGPLALADLDADGELELFVAGRAVGGRYPEPATSRLYRCQNSEWIEDEPSRMLFDKIGLVSGAVYRQTGAETSTDNVLGLPPLVLTAHNTLNLIGQGSATDVRLRQVFHVTVDATGKVAGFKDETSVVCH